MTEQECQRRLEVILEKKNKIKKLNEKITALKNKIKELEDQRNEIKECKKEIKHLKSEKDESERRIAKLKNQIEELREKLDEKVVRLDSLEKELEESNRSHKKKLDEMKECHKKDIDELKDNSEKRRHEMIENHKILEEMSKAFDMNEEEVTKLKEANTKMKNKLKENKKLICSHEKDQKLYLGQICSDVQTIFFRHVLPDQYADGFSYKFKDIEEHINDDDMLDETGKKEANKRYEELQTKINQKRLNLKRLKGAIRLLQDQRNQVAHPKDLSEERARKAAEELERQNKLKGKIKFEIVEQIIDLWIFLKSLPCDRNSNHK